MAEMGIDISNQRSKSLDEFLNQSIETVITVCDKANEACPVFPGQANRLHWPFEDPSRVLGSDAERLEHFRRARDTIWKVFEGYAVERRAAVSQASIIRDAVRLRPG